VTRTIRTLVVALGIALCVAAPATASTWRGLGPLDATERTSPSNPPVALAANSSGLAIAGWLSRDPTGGATGDGGVRIVERAAGAGWGTRQTIKPPDGTFSNDIEVGLGDDGFGVAAWHNDPTGVAYSARSTAGTWGAPIALSAGFDPQVAMQPDGQAVVAWNEGTQVRAALIAENGVAGAAFTVFAPAAGSTIDAIDLTRAGGATPTVIEVLWHDASGLHVEVDGIFITGTTGSPTPYYCGGGAPGTFDPPASALAGATPGFVPDSASVVADTVGGIVAGYAITADAGNTTRKVVLARCQPGVSGWQQVVNIGGEDPAPALALSSAGRVVAAWGAPAGLAVTTRNLRNGSDWDAPSVPLTFASVGAPDTTSVRAAVAFDSSANAVVAADFLRAGDLVFTSVHQLAGAAWSADSIDAQHADAQASPYTPGLVSTRRGGFVATWRNPLNNTYPRTGDLDVEPPAVTVSGLSGAIVAGQAVTASASVTDNWSGFVAGSVRFDFGDGTSGTGDSLAHTYLTPGPKTVVVTARDAADNVGQATLTLNVSAPVIAFTGATLVKPTWKASRLSGKLHLAFTPPPGARLRVAILTSDGKKALLDEAVAAGADIKLPRRLLPGRYLVRLTGTSNGAAIVPATRTITVPAPKEGVVSSAFLTPRKNGQPRTSVAGFQSSLFAYITFASRPKGAVQVAWFGPKGERYASSGPYRGKRLEFYYKLKTGLSHGTWRVVVSSRGRISATLAIKLK
jgi:PKD repeat protein